MKKPLVPVGDSNTKKIQLDAFDVRHRFAENPLLCLAAPNARLVLRSLEFPYRHWHKVPSDAQTGSQFWDDLSQHLLEKFGEKKIAHRFADFLVGFLLVTENETPGRSSQDRNTSRKLLRRTVEVESAAKRERELHRVNRIVGAPATSRPQRRESLQLLLTRAMADDLTKVWKKRKIVCEDLIPQIWSAIGITVKPSSILRTERRSRHRTIGTK